VGSHRRQTEMDRRLQRHHRPPRDGMAGRVCLGAFAERHWAGARFQRGPAGFLARGTRASGRYWRWRR
jgi:hypothetical protein